MKMTSRWSGLFRDSVGNGITWKQNSIRFLLIKTAQAFFITWELIADRNMMLHFQKKFSLSSMSSLVKGGIPGTSQLLSTEYHQLNYSSCLPSALSLAELETV